MVLEEIEKSKFAQINEKRYIFSGRSSSLPFFFHIFMKLFSLKETKNKKIELHLQEEKHEPDFIRAFYNKTQHFIILTC